LATIVPTKRTRSPALMRSGLSGPTSSTQIRAWADPTQKPFRVTAVTTLTPEASAVSPTAERMDCWTCVSRTGLPSTNR